MTVSIGDITRGTSTLGSEIRSSRVLRPDAEESARRARELRQARLDSTRSSQAREGNPTGERNLIPSERAGFGDGSISVPGSAVRTLNGGLAAGRRVVPTLEEIQQQRRANQAEQSEQRRTVNEKRAPQAAERQASPTHFEVRSAAAARSRDFVRNLNTTAATTDARLRGEDPEPQNAPATVQVGRESFTLRREPAPQFLDVSV